MSEKLSDAEVEESLWALRGELSEMLDHMTRRDGDPEDREHYPCTDQRREDWRRLRVATTARRIAALDAVLAERRERKNESIRPAEASIVAVTAGSSGEPRPGG